MARDRARVHIMSISAIMRKELFLSFNFNFLIKIPLFLIKQQKAPAALLLQALSTDIFIK